MKVKCLKILQGGRRNGREIQSSGSIHIGGEYVVLAMSAHAADGVSYMLLRDASASRVAVWPAEMFEITSGKIPSCWHVTSPYDAGAVTVLGPSSWSGSDIWTLRDSGDKSAAKNIQDAIAVLYREEGEPIPEALI